MTKAKIFFYLFLSILSLVEGLKVDRDHKILADKSNRPPPPQQKAEMARYVVHESEYCSIATTSTRPSILGYPFANGFSMSDGSTWENASGIPYFYLTDIEASVMDMNMDNRCSMTVTLAQGNYCKDNGFDQQDPTCPRIILTGRMVYVESGSPEEGFAQDALFSRHPNMVDWPSDHQFFFAKLDIDEILVLDFFGGMASVPIDEYFAANVTSSEIFEVA